MKLSLVGHVVNQAWVWNAPKLGILVLETEEAGGIFLKLCGFVVCGLFKLRKRYGLIFVLFFIFDWGRGVLGWDYESNLQYLKCPNFDFNMGRVGKF